MRLLKLTRIIHSASLVAALIALAVAWPAAAQTSIKFSLDGRLEGLAATFFLPQDRGYFKSEGLDVTVDEATTALEPITRVASGRFWNCSRSRAADRSVLPSLTKMTS